MFKPFQPFTLLRNMNFPPIRSIALVGLFASAGCLWGQPGKNPSEPQPTPLPPAIVAPLDKPYAGPLQLEVDVTDTEHHVMHVRENVPVQEGTKELVLLYPQWIPGHHSPTGPISHLAGVVTSVDGR